MRKPYLLVVLMLAASMLSFPAGAGDAGADDDGDAELMRACPGFAAWAATQQRQRDVDSAPSPDADRKLSEPALGAELALRVEADQKARSDSAANGNDRQVMEAMLAVDADNLAWIKNTISTRGFPSVAEVGEQGVSNAWLLVQHADADAQFQMDVLKTLESLPEDSGIRKSQIATLTDRVLVAQGKPQRYATQFKLASDGSLAPVATEDLAGVDQRRADMGLMSLSVYRCVLGVSYAAEAAPTE